MAKPIYIYRSGVTSKCALTAVKDDRRLPPPATPDSSWYLWMQIGPRQAQHGRCDFDIRAAMRGIARDGYYGCYLLTGSRALLHKPALARSKPAFQGGHADV